MGTDHCPSCCSEVNGITRGVNLVNHASVLMVLLGIWFIALLGLLALRLSGDDFYEHRDPQNHNLFHGVQKLVCLVLFF